MALSCQLRKILQKVGHMQVQGFQICVILSNPRAWWDLWQLRWWGAGRCSGSFVGKTRSGRNQSWAPLRTAPNEFFSVVCSFSLGFLISHFRVVLNCTLWHVTRWFIFICSSPPLCWEQQRTSSSQPWPEPAWDFSHHRAQEFLLCFQGFPLLPSFPGAPWISLSTGDISSVLFFCLATAPPLCLLQQKTTAKSKQDEIMGVFLGQPAMPWFIFLLLRSHSIPGGSAFSSCLAHSSTCKKETALEASQTPQPH